jgi:hypothetical protein
MNSKFTPVLALAIALLFSFNTSYSQDQEVSVKTADSIKIKRFNLGLKLGIPNLLGGSAEILLPLLNNGLAPFVDFSGLDLNTNDIATNLSYLEYGVNYYPNKKGNGFFLALGRAQFKTDLTFYDLVFNEAGQSIVGDASTAFDFNTTNIKLGIKAGSRIYFRFELGYGFGAIPKEVEFTAQSGGIEEFFSEPPPPMPGVSSGGIIIGNIGFGLAF